MNLKEKLANIMNGNFNKDKMTEYDRILSCSVKGETKGAFMTTDCTNVKLLPSKCKTGLIDVGEILDAEFDNSESYHHKAINFVIKIMLYAFIIVKMIVTLKMDMSILSQLNKDCISDVIVMLLMRL